MGEFRKNFALKTIFAMRLTGSASQVRPTVSARIGWAKGYATGAHRFETPDAAAASVIRTKPAMATWGEADRPLRAEHFLPQFAELFPPAPIHRFVISKAIRAVLLVWR